MYSAKQQAFSQLPLILVLVMKNNPISLLTGITYQKFNYLHRAASRACLLCSWIHVVLWTPRVWARGHFSHPYIISVSATGLKLAKASGTSCSVWLHDAMGDQFAHSSQSGLGVFHCGSHPIHTVSRRMKDLINSSMFLVAAVFHWAKLSYWVWVRCTLCSV